MADCLKECQLTHRGCDCTTCKGLPLEAGALALPACSITRKHILRQVVADAAAEFDTSKYACASFDDQAIGNFSGLMYARFMEQLQQRTRQRRAAAQLVWHAKRQAWAGGAQKRNIRIEGLRSQIGPTAFREMVEVQQAARRNKGAVHRIGGERLQRALTWWNSAEAMPYRRGLLPPAADVVCPNLAWEGGDGLPGSPPPPNMLHRAARWLLAVCVFRSQKQPVTVSVDVACSAIAKVAVAVANAGTDMRTGVDASGLRVPCRCKASITFDFDAKCGDRAARVHVARGEAADAVLLDAASLDAVCPGDVLWASRRLTHVQDRVVSITGYEPVAVCLPRPHDEFDSILRGAVPPTTLLPTGWDITERVSEVQLRFSWPTAGRDHMACIQIRRAADESAVAVVEEESAIRLILEALDAHRASARTAVQFRSLRRQRQRQVLDRHAQMALAPFRFVASHVAYPFLQEAWKASRFAFFACRAALAAAKRRIGFPLARRLDHHFQEALAVLRSSCAWASDCLLVPLAGEAMRCRSALWTAVYEFAGRIGPPLHSHWSGLCSLIQRTHQTVVLPSVQCLGAVRLRANKEAMALRRQLGSVARSMCEKALSPVARNTSSACVRSARLAWKLTFKLIDCLQPASVSLVESLRNEFDSCSRWWSCQPLPRRVLGGICCAFASAWQGVVICRLWPCISTCTRLAFTKAQSILGSTGRCIVSFTWAARDRIQGAAACAGEVLRLLNKMVSPVVAPALGHASAGLRMCRAIIHRRCQGRGMKRQVARPAFQMARIRRFDDRHAVK